jgi:uncharacterized delta-60 repeat protein
MTHLLLKCRREVTSRLWAWLILLAWILCRDVPAEMHLEWARSYRLDSAKTNSAWKVLPAKDGGVIVGGTSASEAGDSDYALVKYNANGDQGWVRRHNSAPGFNDVVYDMTVDPKGDILVVGTSGTVKYSAAGDFVWVQPYSGRAVIANDEVVYVTGFSGFSTVQLKNDNVDGATNWVRTYNGPGAVSGAITFSKSGGVLVGGLELTAGGPRISGIDFTILRYTAEGNLSSSVTTQIHDMGFGPAILGKLSLAEDSSGELHMYGRMGTRTFLVNPHVSVAFLNTPGEMKLDLDGNAVINASTYTASTQLEADIEKYQRTTGMLWQRTYKGGFTGPAEASALEIAPTGQYYSAGYATGSRGDHDFLVLRYSSDGQLIDATTYDGRDQRNDVAADMAIDSASSIYVTGFSITAEGGSEFLTLKYSDVPKVEKLAGGGAQVEFWTGANQPYAIEATVDFLSWESLMTNTADIGGLVRFLDTNVAGMPKRFYRGKKP